MAFTVTRHGNNFRISIGDGKPADTQDVAGVLEAVQHYWGSPYHSYKRKDCPFCQQQA
jgi:hypothetical protein